MKVTALLILRYKIISFPNLMHKFVVNVSLNRIYIFYFNTETLKIRFRRAVIYFWIKTLMKNPEFRSF